MFQQGLFGKAALPPPPTNPKGNPAGAYAKKPAPPPPKLSSEPLGEAASSPGLPMASAARHRIQMRKRVSRLENQATQQAELNKQQSEVIKHQAEMIKTQTGKIKTLQQQMAMH